jgi:hypothetical protein
MEEANIGFILGMIAGEGSFSIHLRQYDGGVGVSGSPIFQLALKDDDAEILHAMCETTGHGKVRYSSNGSHRNRAMWRIRGWESCLEFADNIEAAAEKTGLFKETDKYSTFVEWKRIIEEHDDKREIGEKSVEEAKELVKKAKSLNSDGNNGLSLETWLDRIEE